MPNVEVYSCSVCKNTFLLSEISQRKGNASHIQIYPSYVTCGTYAGNIVICVISHINEWIKAVEEAVFQGQGFQFVFNVVHKQNSFSKPYYVLSSVCLSIHQFPEQFAWTSHVFWCEVYEMFCVFMTFISYGHFFTKFGSLELNVCIFE
jgi:hypothetical protein